MDKSNHIVDKILFLTGFFLIIGYVPKPLQLNMIGGPMAGKLTIYPVLLLWCYSLYCCKKGKRVFISSSHILKYLLAYMGILFLSLGIGLYTYPYYQVVLNGPVEQIDKLPKLLSILAKYHISVSKDTVMLLWMSVRWIKSIILETFYYWGTMYLVICWYKDEPEKGFKVFTKGAIYGLGVFFIVGIIDILYLGHIEWTKQILKQVTPLFHPVVEQHGWWPPLLWINQFRSVFPEPSWVGNYTALILPLLYSKVWKSKGKRLLQWSSILFLFTFMCFMAQARTATVMYLIVFALVAVGILVVYKNKYWKKLLLVTLVGVIGFSASVFYISNIQNVKVKPATTSDAIDGYVNSNITSLSVSNQRSNGARYALIKSGVRVWLESPVLGVGKGLGSAFIIDHFTQDEANNKEVHMWITDSNEQGLLRYSLGTMTEYFTRLVETGTVGLLIFLCPFIYILYGLGKRLLLANKDNSISYEFWLFIIIVANLASGMNGSVNLIPFVWIILGVGYSYIHQNSVNNIKNDKN